MEKIKVHHPFLDRAIVPVMANYVTAEDGTGIVHTAPGHGREDNMTGVQYGIDIYCAVDEAREDHRRTARVCGQAGL